jgi:serine/threonine protein kinase
MRQCPLCSRLYEDATEFCPQDGRVLFLPDPLLGTILDGKYRVDALLGGGGQGAVYRTMHVHLQRTTALKVVRGAFVADADAIERFKREALAVARLKHPYIVTIHDFGITAEVGAYIVMEYLAGHSLYDEIRRGSRVPVGPALELMRQICIGVHAAHKQGIIHRDLKPDNIFLETRDDRSILPKILDFGLAKLWDRSGLDDGRRDTTDNSAADRVFGTAAYMSPEQSLGEPLDARTDVYSLGCVFYEMITGRPPYLFTGSATINLKHLEDTPQPPSVFEPSVPDALDAVLLRGLAKQRDERFQTAEEFGRALDAIRAQTDSRVTISGASTFSSAYQPSRSPAEPFEAYAVHYAAAAVVPPSNLPQPVTNFIGRQNEIGVVTRLLSTNRLVTLTGPGGCGKTRLSLEVADQLLPTYPDGVWLVELAALADLSLVPQAVASVLGVSGEPRQLLVDALIDLLRSKRALLVLDNCEHLISACATLVSTLLRGCRYLRVLASSQHGMGILGETTWSVFSLSLPDRRDPSLESAEYSEARIRRWKRGKPSCRWRGPRGRG